MNRKHREEFLCSAVALGIKYQHALTMTRLAATHDRLSEAQCNGDWPCDNGERPVVFCARCGAGYVLAATKQTAEGRICQSCRTEDLLTAEVARYPGIAVEFSGDPRGWTVKLSRREGAA